MKNFGIISSQKEEENLPEKTSLAKDDLFYCLKPMLIFGKVLFLCPYNLTATKEQNPNDFLPSFSKKSWCAILSYLMLIFFFVFKFLIHALVVFDIVFNDSKHEEVTGIEKLFHSAIFISLLTNLWMNCSFLWHGEKFCTLFKSWREICSSLHYTRVNTTLKRNVNFLFIIVMISAIAENLCNSFRYLPFSKTLKQEENCTWFEIYYRRENGPAAEKLTYNPFLAFMLFLTHKQQVYTVNLVAILIGTISFSLASRFSTLNDFISGNSESMSINWKMVKSDYQKLAELAQIAEDFLSPYIFQSLMIIMIWIAFLIFMGVSSNNMSLLDKIYSVWSIFHLTARFFLVYFTTCAIHDNSRHLLVLVQKRQQDFPENVALDRLERLICSRPLALTGLKTFEMTRKLILSFINVIFTIEIVLLQGSRGRGQNLHFFQLNSSESEPSDTLQSAH